MNKICTALVALSVLILAAWSPLETSNHSIVRLSYADQDFCSGVIVERVNEDFAYAATAAHCADAMAIPMEEVTYLPNGESKIRYFTAYPNLRFKTDVVDEEGNVQVSFDMDASFVRLDHENDVAIYVVYDAGYMKPIPLSKTIPQYGDKVYAMGMPLAIWGTISSGEVSKPRLGNTQGIPKYIPQDAIVHTAYMKGGISGGGLINDKGELIGLTNWGLPGGPYMATRVSHVIDLLEKIKTKSEISNENQ